MVSNICYNCGKPIKANHYATHQKFCCVECRNQYHKENKDTSYFTPFFFECSQCGKRVEITDEKDRRTRFCCASCEKKYWRHPPYEQETSRTNFHSVQEYLSWERRTNE